MAENAKRETGLSRSLPKAFDRSKADKDKRTIELAFSSEMPVERWGENEVLSHDKGDYDFSRLNDSHPLLLGHDEHDPKSQIGVIESARVDSDKVGRAIVRFGNSDLAKEIWQDVQDGIRELVSVGYDRNSIVSSKKDPNGMETVRYRWTPTHIAIVTVPADTRVGVGRSKKRLCPDCEGSGVCPECGGSGEGDGDGDNDEDDRCMRCGGNGRCRDCHGNGYIVTAKSHQVDSHKNSKSKDKIMATEIIEADVRRDERAKATADVEKTERTRLAEITTAADLFIEKHGGKDDGKAKDKVRELAKEAIQNGDSPDKFNARVMAYVINAKDPVPVLARDVVPREEMAQFSLARCIQSAAKNKRDGKPGRPDELEGEIVSAYEKRCRESEGGMGPFAPEGFLVPPDAQFGAAGMSRKEMLSQYRKMTNRYGRDMQATVFGQGGAVVPTFWQLPVIELLRNKEVLSAVGMRTLAGLTGNVILPRLEAPSTAFSVAEIAAITASQQTLGQITMTPKRVGNTVNYSKQLVFQSAPDIEALIRDDMFEVIALKWDYLGINGQGAASEPLGLLNTPGIGAVTFGATPTYIKMVSFETAIRVQNVRAPLAYVSTSATKGSLKTVAVALTGATTTISGAQNAIWVDIDGDSGMEVGRIAGYPAIDSQQVPNNQVIAGCFTHFVRGLWAGIDVVVDYYTKAVNAEVAVTMNTWGDFAVRHPQAFCASTDAGNQ